MARAKNTIRELCPLGMNVCFRYGERGYITIFCLKNKQLRNGQQKVKMSKINKGLHSRNKITYNISTDMYQGDKQGSLQWSRKKIKIKMFWQVTSLYLTY